jgi:hypothetical protein
MTQQQLIWRLKQQPRQSTWIEDFGRGIAATTDALREFGRFTGQALNAAEDLTKQLIKTGTEGFKGLTESSTAMNIGLSKTIEINQVLQKKFLDVAKAASFVEERNSILNKSFGISSVNAAKLSQQFLDMSKAQQIAGQKTAISAEAMMEYAGSIKKILPTYDQANKKGDQYYKGLQQTQAALVTGIGLSEEQANSFTQFAGANAANAAQQLKATEIMAKAMGDQDGSLGFVKQITEGIAEAGSEIQLQYGRLPGSLERATIKAGRLGLKLEDLAGSGENLLDIENSIGQELEYQLLTGRRLVNDQNQSLTNLYREATLRGDANKQADILTEIVQKEGKTLENNLFARKQMADLLGIQEGQLASAIQKQKILEKAGEAGISLNLDDEGSIAKAAEALKEAGALDEKEFDAFMQTNDTRTTDDLLKEQLTIANEQLMYTRMDVQANRENLIKAAEKMANASTGMSASELEGLGQALTILSVPQAAAKEIIDSAATATVDGAGSVRGKKSDDLVATPTGYGDRILLAGEDTFALNNDDTIVAGTNLFPQQSSGGNNTVAKLDELIKAIHNQTRVLSSRDNTFGAGINSAYYG